LGSQTPGEEKAKRGVQSGEGEKKQSVQYLGLNQKKKIIKQKQGEKGEEKKR